MIKQIMKYSILISFVFTACLCLFKCEMTPLGVFMGSLWGCLNLYLIEVLIKEMIIKKNVLLTSVFILIKFPILYWIGYKLLSFTQDNPWYAVGGLSLIFTVTFIRVLIPVREEFA